MKPLWNVASLIHSAREWMEGGVLHVEDASVDIGADTLLIVDLDDAVVQFTRLTGDPRHAAGLLARQIRSTGLMDEPPEVFCHTVRREDRHYDVLSTAMPGRRWRELLAWTQAQRFNVALVPVAALLWRSLPAGEALVFRSGSRFTFLANVEGRPVHLGVQAFSDDPAELRATLELLADGALAELSAQDPTRGTALHSLTWYTRLAPADRLSDQADADGPLATLVADRLKVPLVHAPVSRAHRGDLSFVSSIPQLGLHFHVGLAANPAAQRWALRADQALPAATRAAWVLASLTLTASAALGLLAHRGEVANQARLAQAIVIEEAIARHRADDSLETTYAATAAWVGKLADARANVDIVQMLQALRLASDKGVRVNRVYTVAPEKAQENTATPGPARGVTAATSARPARLRVYVDANLDPASGRPDHEVLAQFLTDLAQQGFKAVPGDGATRAAQRQKRIDFTYELQPTGESNRAPGVRS